VGPKKKEKDRKLETQLSRIEKKSGRKAKRKTPPSVKAILKA